MCFGKTPEVDMRLKICAFDKTDSDRTQALEMYTIMRYENPHFTYLLIYSRA